MKSNLVLIAIILFSSWSCKKDKATGKNQEETGSGGMIVSSTSVNADRSSVYLDLDKDGANDLCLKYDRLKINGPLFRNRYQVVCLNPDLELSGNFITDTLFYNDSSYYYTNTQSQVQLIRICNYTFHRISPSDSIIEIQSNNFKPIYTDNWQAPVPTDIFKHDSVIVMEQPFYTNNYSPGGDTIVTTTFYSNYKPFPVNQTKYLNLRIKSKNGYIEFTITSDFKINVFETGIQK